MNSDRPKILLLIKGEEVQERITNEISEKYYGAEFTYAENLRELELRAIHGDLTGPYDAIIAFASPADNVTRDDLNEKLSWLLSSGHARNNPICLIFDFGSHGHVLPESGPLLYSPPPSSKRIAEIIEQNLETRKAGLSL